MSGFVSRDAMILCKVEDGADLAALTLAMIEGNWTAVRGRGAFGPFVDRTRSPLGLRFELEAIADVGVTMIREVFDAWVVFGRAKPEAMSAFSAIEQHVAQLVDISESCFRGELGPRYTLAHREIFAGHAFDCVGRVKTFVELAVFSHEHGLTGALPGRRKWMAAKPLTDGDRRLQRGFVTLRAAADWALSRNPARLHKLTATKAMRRTARSEVDTAAFMLSGYDVDLRAFGHRGDGRGWRELRRDDWIPEFDRNGEQGPFAHVIVSMHALLAAFPPPSSAKRSPRQVRARRKQPPLPDP